MKLKLSQRSTVEFCAEQGSKVMARASSFLKEEQFECSICTDIFSNPVSLPCGHNFCDGCIGRHWEGKEVCKCPLCKREFNKSLKLNINTLFRDIVDNYKEDYVVSDSEKPSGPEDVLCDCCLESRRRAAQTCLVCLTSFCKSHLEPHLRVSSLKTHTLTDPVPNLQQKMCPKHNRILEETSCDQTKVCVLCANNEKKGQSNMKSEKHVYYIKMKNSRKTKRNKNKHAAPRVEKMEHTNETESLENVKIWHNNVLYTFLPLPSHFGFSTGRVYYDVPNVGNSSCTIGVVNAKMRGNMVFSTKTHQKWVVRYNNFCECPAGCPIEKNNFPDRVLVCVDYEQGLMFIVHPLDGIVLLCMTNCNFKGELFLFIYRNKYVPHVKNWTPCKNRSDVFFAIVFMIILFYAIFQN